MYSVYFSIILSNIQCYNGNIIKKKNVIKFLKAQYFSLFAVVLIQYVPFLNVDMIS